MRGAQRGPFESPGRPEGPETAAPSRLLTPTNGLAPESEGPNEAANEAANEDFLFHLYRGSELLQDNRAHEAKEELERALHLQPHDAKGQDLLAVVYFRLGLYPRAISIYEQLRRTSPRDPALLLNLALCYLKTGQAALARRDLELLLDVNPSHQRAWGYLGLACERLGALVDAQYAFEQGGHGQMARRMVERRASQAPVAVYPEESIPSREVRDVVAAAFEELDAGELSFELAKPASDSRDNSPDSWLPVELGHMQRRPDAPTHAPPRSDALDALDDRKPDTRDGPPRAPSRRIAGASAKDSQHRNTLMIGVAPPHEIGDLAALSRTPSPRPPPFGEESGTGAAQRSRIPVVRVPGFSPPADMGTWDPSTPPSKRTLPPPPARPPSAPPVQVEAPLRAVTAPPPDAQLTRPSIVALAAWGNVVVHPSGVALVRTALATGFAARLEALRASSNALTMKLLERHVKGKPTGESFGGVGSPLVHATGEGQLLLAPRAGRKLSSFALEADDMCFVREEVLLGFDGELTFENGRLATGEGELVAVVQLKGKGAVLLETIGEILTLEVHGSRGLSVRREVILGWFGRLVPRALPTSEAPCGQRGLVSFAGEGRVLVASA